MALVRHGHGGAGGGRGQTVVDDFFLTVVGDFLGTVLTVGADFFGTVVLGRVVAGALCLVSFGRGAPRTDGGVTASDSRFSASFSAM